MILVLFGGTKKRVVLIGDSHVNSFRGIRGVEVHHVGAMTMKRFGHEDEGGIKFIVDRLKKDDIVLFCFGEIDVRCRVKPESEWHKIPYSVYLEDLANKYVKKIRGFGLKRAGVINITPPTVFGRADSVEHPVRGSDLERIKYTKELNRLLKEKSEGLIYVDVYSKYEVDGMLPKEKSDGTVHIRDKKGLRKILDVQAN